jgi:AraC-like DNA-binding protein
MLEKPPCMRNRTDMTDDAISAVLRLADVESVASGGFTAGGEWAIRFPPPDKIKFFAAVRGESWLKMDDEAEPRRLVCGDVVLLVTAIGFVISSDPLKEPVLAHSLFADRTDPIVTAGGGDDVLMIGGHVRVHPTYASMLSDALPPVIHVHGTAPEAQRMRWVLEGLVEESHGDLPGSGMASTQLAHLLFIQILRAHLATGESLKTGWLRAAADPRLGMVLRHMHGDPAKPWRLEQLASMAAMSRTVFASQFKAAVGVAPLAYLARWRMRLAEHALRRGDVPVAVLARDLGYASESAFSHAFKRLVGTPPSRYADAPTGQSPQ